MPFDQGWALKGKKKVKRFSKEQKTFLTHIFTEGQRTGCKTKLALAAQKMKQQRDDLGNVVFRPADCLTEQQIKAFFANLHRQSQGPPE
jgi:hypothetical protein